MKYEPPKLVKKKNVAYLHLYSSESLIQNDYKFYLNFSLLYD